MSNVGFVDTTLRDGDQSIWGSRMATRMILPVISQMDEAGFEALEIDALTVWKMRVRQQREEPWERIRLLAKRITRTPISIMCGASTGQFDVAPLAFAKLRLERFAANGIKRVQVTGFLNDLTFKVPELVRFAHEAGLQVVLGLTFTESPKHTDEYYAGKAAEAVKLGADRLYIKDPGGLLTPERTRTLAPAVMQVSRGLAVELHSHCTTGLAPLCYLEAIKLGIKTLHTGIPPLANGPGQPSIFNIAKNARLLGYNPQLKVDVLRPVADHFRFIARREGLPLGEPVEYDYGQYRHQIPGGVISNLKRQLAEMKKGDLLPAVMEEAVQVRKDLGYPIMVTPFSQHMVTQATINVVVGERYKEVSDELIQFCLGYWGREASSGVEPWIRDKIVDRPRAKELSRQERIEPSIEDIRQRLGGTGVSDDELVVRYIMGGAGELLAMRPALPVKEYPSAAKPLLALLQELVKMQGARHIRVEKGNLSLILAKSA